GPPERYVHVVAEAETVLGTELHDVEHRRPACARIAEPVLARHQPAGDREGRIAADRSGRHGERDVPPRERAASAADRRGTRECRVADVRPRAGVAQVATTRAVEIALVRVVGRLAVVAEIAATIAV